MGTETENNGQTCWMADDAVLCSEENCPMTYNPALCFEPGEQRLETELPEPKLIQNPAAAKPLFEKEEIENAEPEPAENITHKKEEIKDMKKETKPKRKYTRRANAQPIAAPPQDNIINTLTAKLHEHNKAVWEIYGIFSTVSQLGISVVLPVLKWPE
jgi:hypothetical protein